MNAPRSIRESTLRSLANQGLLACLLDGNGNSHMSSGMSVACAYRMAVKKSYLEASSMATATATVMPTMGLLPAPIRPIIST